MYTGVGNTLEFVLHYDTNHTSARSTNINTETFYCIVHSNYSSRHAKSPECAHQLI